jgi:TonB family protein
MKLQSARQLLVRSLSIVALLGSTCLLGHAQTSARKVIQEVEPAYPAQSRDRGVGGTVGLKVTVQADGTVRDVQVEYGDPNLAESAVRAVKLWRYAPGESETVEEVTINFTDSNQ